MRRIRLNAALGLILACFLPVVWPAAADQKERLVLKGYDTVAYFTEGRARPGDPQYETEFDGGIYRFATSRHREMFQTAPDKYVPQFGNFCTASLSRGVKVVADPENWYIHEGRLHVFGKPIGPGLMQQDAHGMEQRAREHFATMME